MEKNKFSGMSAKEIEKLIQPEFENEFNVPGIFACIRRKGGFTFRVFEIRRLQRFENPDQTVEYIETRTPIGIGQTWDEAYTLAHSWLEGHKREYAKT